MGPAPAQAIDARGFAMVTDYELPTPVWPEKLWHVRKRMCGNEANEALPRLISSIRFALDWERQFNSQLLRCSGLTCQIAGVGEWGTSTRFSFRSVAGGLALDTWSEQSSDLEPGVMAKAGASIRQGLLDLAWVKCPP